MAWTTLQEAYDAFQGYIGSLEGVNSITQLAQGAGVVRIPDLLSGNSGDPRDSGNPYTGVAMLFPVVTINGVDYRLVGMNAGTLKFGLGANGTGYFGGGVDYLDENGITITVSTGAQNSRAYKFSDGTNVISALYSWFVGNTNFTELVSNPTTGRDSVVFIKGSAPTGQVAQVTIETDVNDVTNGAIDLQNNSGASTASISADIIYINPQTRTGFVFNEAGSDRDGRFEGDADANLLYTDASTDRVGIGTATPSVKLDVAGAISASGAITGSNLSGTNTGDQTLAGLGATPNDGWIADTNTWSYSSGIRTQAYTNDPAAGSDVVLNVASTSGFVIGDPVTVSSSAGSENTYIVNLVANTSITVKVLALNHTTTSPLITLLEQTYVISINADVTALIGVKDRIKLTQSTAKYFIVTAVGAFSGGATLVTVFGGTDYTLANTTITSPFYSHVQNPFGFPPSPNKWTVTASTTDAPAKATPAASTWYGGNLLTPDGPILPLPIGEWRVYYKTSGDVVATLAAVAATGMRMTVSTANNSESDNELTSVVLVSLPIGTDTQRGLYTSEKSIAVTTKTPYYLNILTGNTGTTSITMNAAAIKTVFKAVCAYL